VIGEFGLGAVHRDRRFGFAELDDERAVRAVFVAQRFDRAVEDQRAVIDQHDAPAEPLDVGQIVRGEDERRAALAVDARR
jgi:hypothetical protein